LTTEHQRRVRELFDLALDQPANLRREFLADACAGDQLLLDTVGRLLAVQERSGGILDTPVRERPEVPESPGEPGTFIGPYKILQELGGGGMGIVYQAVRADEVFRRICAIKVIRPELSSEWLLERFRQERQILARLDHANIARIVDGGSTPDGLPYFVMDYVDGPSIGTFCTQHALSIRQRLVLFQQVCAAVDYLHRNGVVHGDLKPPNILVGNDSAVKLVDFGIASALSASEPQGQSKSLPLMTPGYASPEQLRGQPLSALSDVYSLGVILYELLTGRRPFDAASRSRNDILNAITTQDPVPPSAIAKTIASTLKGDLDCIVLRAMHRDPAHRYSSVGELNADIGRYLQNRPVSGRKGGLLYRGRKLIARNRGGALATLVIAALLGTTAWQGVELHQRYEYSKRQEERIRQLQARLNETQKKVNAELSIPAPPGGKSVPAQAEQLRDAQLREAQLRDAQLRDIRSLAEAYRTSFPEAVRVWPGMTRDRRELLDQADSYLRQAEPFVTQDPKAPEQLAGAWLWLANVEGNPQTVNLHDHAGAVASINEARRLLEKSPGVHPRLSQQVQAAASQIEAAR